MCRHDEHLSGRYRLATETEVVNSRWWFDRAPHLPLSAICMHGPVLHHIPSHLPTHEQTANGSGSADDP